MSLIRAPQQRFQPQGTGALNDAHPLRRYVKFAFLGSAGKHRDLTRHALTSGASASIVTSAAGVGLKSDAANSHVYKQLSSGEISDFTGDLTLIWHGVILGDHTISNDRLLDISFNNTDGSPFVVAGLYRPGADQAALVYASNNGSFINASQNASLNSFYGRPLTIIAANAAGSSAVRLVVRPIGGAPLNASLTMTGSSGNPRSSSATSSITIGGIPGGNYAPNATTTAALILNRAVSEPEAVWISQNIWSFFSGPSRDIATSLMYAAGGANIQAGSPTAAAGTATVSGTGAATAAATATAAAGAASVSAAGASTAAATATAADGTATVSATGAATAAATATAADGTATVSATGAATAAATATAAAGEASVSAVGATAGATGQPPQGFLLLFGTLFDATAGIAAGSPTAAAGVATVSAVGAARAAADPVAAAGEALVSAVGSTGGSISAADPTAAAGAATVSAIGAALAAATATAADGVAVVSAVGAATAAATATAAAGEASVSATGAAVGVFAATAVPAAGQATVSAAGADANAVPSQPGSGRARLRGPATWSDPLNDDDLTRDDDELLEIVAALAAAGVLDGLARLPGSARI